MNEDVVPQTYAEKTHKEVIQACARVFAEACLYLLANDQHTFGKRPCQTCRAISTMLGKPFGCLTHNEIVWHGKDTNA
jgi:hypothetical protein